jgi:hypothetical protein
MFIKWLSYLYCAARTAPSLSDVSTNGTAGGPSTYIEAARLAGLVRHERDLFSRFFVTAGRTGLRLVSFAKANAFFKRKVALWAKVFIDWHKEIPSSIY